MKELFCPFTKGKCNYDCVMNNNCFEDGDTQNCMLRSSVESIISFTNGLAVANKQLDKHLKSINDNTGSDHSYSFEISNKLDTIETLLEKITEKKE